MKEQCKKNNAKGRLINQNQMYTHTHLLHNSITGYCLIVNAIQYTILFARNKSPAIVTFFSFFASLALYTQHTWCLIITDHSFAHTHTASLYTFLSFIHSSLARYVQYLSSLLRLFIRALTVLCLILTRTLAAVWLYYIQWYYIKDDDTITLFVFFNKFTIKYSKRKIYCAHLCESYYRTVKKSRKSVQNKKSKKGLQKKC